MSLERWQDDGLTPLERAAGVGALIHGRPRACDCGRCPACEDESAAATADRRRALVNSARSGDAAKSVAGLDDKKAIKSVLVGKVYQEGLARAIVHYMAREALPPHYASIVKNARCIDVLVQGIFYKVCRMAPDLALDFRIEKLRSTLLENAVLLSAYDRVGAIRAFIHSTVDQYFGDGTAMTIPVQPMKHALSAARLHLGIFDVLDRPPGYTAWLDQQSRAAEAAEYAAPRPSRISPGKTFHSRWRVRHLRSLSFF